VSNGDVFNEMYVEWKVFRLIIKNINIYWTEIIENRFQIHVVLVMLIIH